MRHLALAALLVGALLPTAAAQQNPPAERIQFYATLESARAEARRTGKPIFFTAARLNEVPGIW